MKLGKGSRRAKRRQEKTRPDEKNRSGSASGCIRCDLVHLMLFSRIERHSDCC